MYLYYLKVTAYISVRNFPIDLKKFLNLTCDLKIEEFEVWLMLDLEVW